MTEPVHVAFVDDEPLLHRIAEFYFRKEVEDGRVVTYNFLDGLQCIQYLRRNKHNQEIQHLFTDLIMPNMDGITLANLVKEEFPSIKLYILSATGMEQYKDRVSESDVQGFFTKPLNFNVIKKFLLHSQPAHCLEEAPS